MFRHPPEKEEGVCVCTCVPIRIPADPEPHDPLVGKDRPKKVKNEKEIGHCPGDEAVEFGRSTARLGWEWWREGGQGRCWRCWRLVFALVTATATAMRGLLLLVSVSDYHDDGDFIRLLRLDSKGLRVAMTKLPNTCGGKGRGLLRLTNGPAC